MLAGLYKAAWDRRRNQGNDNERLRENGGNEND